MAPAAERAGKLEYEIAFLLGEADVAAFDDFVGHSGVV
jgi:hypothetical protein